MSSTQKPSEPVVVVLVCDDKYVRHAAVTIISAIKNSQRRFCFYVFDCGIQPSNIEKLKTWDLGNHQIQIVPMSKVEIFEGFRLKKCYSPAIFYRLLIPDILKDLDKAVYLDSDMIVLDDLGQAWDIEMKKYLLGAVPNEDCFKHPKLFIARKNALGIPLQAMYFNTGCLVFNIKLLQHFHLAERVINFLRKCTNKRVTLPDQDAFNVVIDRKRIIELPLRFNCDISGHYKGLNIQHPCNVNCSWKVWLYPEFFVKHILSRKVKYAYEYFRYAKLTPFKNEISREASIKTIFNCLFKLYFKPIEHFFRYQIRDRIKNVIYNLKTKFQMN